MSFKVIYNPEVYNDIQQAIDWYNDQQSGLGNRFYEILKEHLTLLKKSPSHFSIRYDKVRCLPIRKFPYMIHYRVDDKHKIIKIEAIFCTQPDPIIWSNRKPK